MNTNSIFGSTPPVVKNLIIVNVLMFLAIAINETFMINTFALYYPGSPNFKVMQLLSHMFMHVDFFHLFFNMYVLWMFGCMIERVWGGKKFLTYYFITGFGAVGLHILIQWLRVEYLLSAFNEEQNYQYWHEVERIYGTVTLGASGAVYGVLLAFGLLFPNTELQLLIPPVRLKAIWLVVIFGGLELLLGLMQAGDIAHFAHLGGMLFGFIIIQYWKYKGTHLRNDDYH